MGITFQVVHMLFQLYLFMIFGRVVGSWFPRFSQHTIMRFLRYYTDPYLNLFRRLLPPIGGVMDLSPLLAFFSLQLLEFIVKMLLFRCLA